MDGERQVYWLSDVPAECQVSQRKISDSFVDGNVPGFGWACWHPDVFRDRGGSFGTGRGQLYERQTDGRWLKVEG